MVVGRFKHDNRVGAFLDASGDFVIPCDTCAEPAGIEHEGKHYCPDHGREALYERVCREPTDINEHLPLLRLLASRCQHVTEFGTRGGQSTLALLAAQPDVLITWDINPEVMFSGRVLDLHLLRGKTAFQPRIGDTTTISPIEPTDMLFIDTWHTGKQLLTELERHVDPARAPVRKYLVFHDTFTFGLVGEDGKPPGIRTAILQFQKFFAFPLWKLMRHPETGEVLDLDNNNGLVVLEHVCADGHSIERRNNRCMWCGHVP